MSDDSRGNAPGDELREQARKAHNQMQRALETARQLPPLWGIKEQQGERPEPCATCGTLAYSYKLLEGKRVFICGECSLKEMDDWEAQHPAD